MFEKSARRMTLRQLLTASEKCSRDLIELLHTSLLGKITDLRDLTRPVRRKSHYPTMVALGNSMNKVEQAGDQAKAMMEFLGELMREIREHARRERAGRR